MSYIILYLTLSRRLLLAACGLLLGACGLKCSSNACSRAGSGGSPTRSKLARRYRVRRSAAGLGFRPASCNRARMNRSMSDRAQATRSGGSCSRVGTRGGPNGRKAQWLWRISASDCRAVVVASCPQGTPRRTHSTRIACASAGSGPAGGILSDPS